jgi:hypothetical protein
MNYKDGEEAKMCEFDIVVAIDIMLINETFNGLMINV